MTTFSKMQTIFERQRHTYLLWYIAVIWEYCEILEIHSAEYLNALVFANSIIGEEQ